MRIWDISPRKLCRAHLLGEHRELHAIWVILTQGKTGYRRHPETLRWAGALRALHARHEALVREMAGRGYVHRSPLDKRRAVGRARPGRLVDPIERQYELLRGKKCGCKV